MKKKGLFCIWGGSFRDSVQYTGGLSENSIFQAQLTASQSQLNFLKSLSSEIDVSLIIITYKTNFSHFLEYWFKDFDPLIILIEKPIGLYKLAKKVPQLASRYDCDFYFFLRIDIVLKSKFSEVIYFPEDKIMCPMICNIGVHSHLGSSFHTFFPDLSIEKRNRSRPSEMFIYVPCKFKNQLVSSQIWMYHDFTLTIEYDVYMQVDYYLDTFHDSNSYHDRNPLFYICNRPETTRWQSEFYSHRGDGIPILDYEKNYNEVFKNDQILQFQS